MVTMVSRVQGLRVPFLLFRSLRVSSGTGPSGEPLNFVQEDKTEAPQFWVVLSRPMNNDERFSVTVKCAGKDAIVNEGGGNYFPIARTNWYPNSVSGEFGDYATYDMTFRVSKELPWSRPATA